MTYCIHWPGTTIVKSMNNDFTSWKDGEPSIFAAVKSMRPNKSGLSTSLTATQTVTAFQEETGRSRGTLRGLSRAADQQLTRT